MDPKSLSADQIKSVTREYEQKYTESAKTKILAAIYALAQCGSCKTRLTWISWDAAASEFELLRGNKSARTQVLQYLRDLGYSITPAVDDPDALFESYEISWGA